MTDFGFDLEEIARLIKLVEQRGLAELVVEELGQRVTIRGVGYRSRRSSRASAPDLEHHAASSGAADPAPEPAPHRAIAPPVQNRISVASPMVGVFYRASGPDSDVFVDVGDRVEIGQTIGVIEAMKVFSEIPAEVSGTVLEIVAVNGQLVRASEPLMYLSPA